MSAEPQRFTIPLSDGVMSGLRFGGTGTPRLIFLHANGFHAATYAPLLAPLAALGPVVALDLRGHGASALPADPARLVGWQPYAADVTAVLDSLVPEGQKVTLSGHSLGGTVSLLAARARPDRVKGLVLLDPVLLTPLAYLVAHLPFGTQWTRKIPLAVAAARRRSRFASREEAREWYAPKGAFRSWAPGFLDAYVAGGFVEDGEGVTLACTPAWEAATFGAQRHAAWGSLKRMTMPVDILMAETRSTVHGGIAGVHRALPHARAEVVAGGTHFFPFEVPDLVRHHMAAVLSRS